MKDIHSCFLSRLRQKNLYYEATMVMDDALIIQEQSMEDSTIDSAPIDAHLLIWNPKIFGTDRLIEQSINRRMAKDDPFSCMILRFMEWFTNPDFFAITGFPPIFKGLDPHQREQSNRSLSRSQRANCG